MLDAYYFDGHRAHRFDVQIEVANGLLRVHGLPEPLLVPVAEVELSEPLGRTRRSIALPGGARIELPAGVEAPELAALAPRASRLLAFVHALERRWQSALAALLLGAGVIAGVIHFGLPKLAEQAAFRTPDDLRATLGERALASLDTAALAPSRLEAARAEEVRALFARFAKNAGLEGALRLELRRGGRVGANALALPAGIVVVTDELIARAAHDEHLHAVFAHEAGHIVARHALRSALQHSASATLILVLTGDATSLASLAATIPVLLIQSRYSRDFEREADDYAHQYLKKHGIPSARFAEMLQRLNGGEEEEEGNWADYFSTHPRLKERVRR